LYKRPPKLDNKKINHTNSLSYRYTYQQEFDISLKRNSYNTY